MNLYVYLALSEENNPRNMPKIEEGKEIERKSSFYLF